MYSSIFTDFFLARVSEWRAVPKPTPTRSVTSIELFLGDRDDSLDLFLGVFLLPRGDFLAALLSVSWYWMLG